MQNGPSREFEIKSAVKDLFSRAGGYADLFRELNITNNELAIDAEVIEEIINKYWDQTTINKFYMSLETMITTITIESLREYVNRIYFLEGELKHLREKFDELKNSFLFDG